MITVFYDSQCSLCSREINHYKKIAPKQTFEWLDIINSEKELKEKGITTVEALKSLHAQDESGKLHIGIDAFILIWLQLKRWRLLAFLFSLPIIYQLSKILYKGFAKWRFNRLAHCTVFLKKEK